MLSLEMKEWEFEYRSGTSILFSQSYIFFPENIYEYIKYVELVVFTCLFCFPVGASGDLARKKTFPSLAFLFMNGFLPVRTQVIGYGRTPITMDEFRERLRPTLPGDEEQKLNFLRHCSYVDGSYDGPEGFQKLHELLRKIEMINPQCPVGRLFYLALPPSIYPMVSKMVKEYCDLDPMVNPRSWLRLVVEKPFGRDVESSEELAEQLGCMWPENQLYRIDHYLGKEMLQSLFVMRFANALLAPIWSREHVANVQVRQWEYL